MLLEIYDLWQPRIQECGGTLRLEISSILFNGDEELLKDAIGNLLSNTIKYRNPSKRLRCILSAEARGNWLELSVSDNGLGVPTMDRKRIFQRFVRVEGHNRGYSGGHGLGLSVQDDIAPEGS